MHCTVLSNQCCQSCLYAKAMSLVCATLLGTLARSKVHTSMAHRWLHLVWSRIGTKRLSSPVYLWMPVSPAQSLCGVGRRSALPEVLEVLEMMLKSLIRLLSDSVEEREEEAVVLPVIPPHSSPFIPRCPPHPSPPASQESEYKKLGEEMLAAAWRTINLPDWKLEKKLDNGDMVQVLLPLLYPHHFCPHSIPLAHPH